MSFGHRITLSLSSSFFFVAAPTQFMTPAPVSSTQQQQQREPPANFGRGGKPAAPPVPVDKGPIPPEHAVLQEVFDGLRNKCVAAANHPVRV